MEEGERCSVESFVGSLDGSFDEEERYITGAIRVEDLKAYEYPTDLTEQEEGVVKEE